MVNASYHQSNFLGGEWSPEFQGRVDDPDYKKALALCLNYIPTPEGSLMPRGGFKRIGNTQFNSPSRLLPFRFSAQEPYVASFGGGHAGGNLRLFANGLNVLTTEEAALYSVSGSPPTFTIVDTSIGGTGVVPAAWNTGDSVFVVLNSATNVEAAGYLANREFSVTVVNRSAGTITLSDAVTGAPLTSAVTGLSFTPGVVAGGVAFYRALVFTTHYENPEGIRQVQFTSQLVSGVPGSGNLRFSPPDHKVSYLYPLVCPYSFSAQRTVQYGLFQEQFIDGPYLDSFGTTIPLTVSGTTGSITVTMYNWDTNTYYQPGDLVLQYIGGTTPFYYLALAASKGVSPSSTGAQVNSSWVSLAVNEKAYNSGTTYSIGNMVTAAPYNADQVPTIYYSLISSNTNHTPASSPSDWSTTPPTWSAIVSYPGNSYVVDGGTTYLAIGTPVTGTAPHLDATNWMVAPSLTAPVNTLTNKTTGWLSSPIFYADDAGGSASTIDQGNPGRLIRLKCAPQPWNNKTSYSTNDLVNFNDVIYMSLTNSNLGNEPDTDETHWEIQTATIQWTWGQITYASAHLFQATVQLLGADLNTSHPVWEFRLGVYSDTTGWPTLGVYHEGRLWLGGVFPNRIDGGVADQGYNFAPTAPDGTVADSNGIAVVMNCEESEAVQALSSISEGIVILTNEKEWLCSASALNDPITPTSVQVHPTTAWSAYPTETARLPSALAAIQGGGRRVLEYRAFIDLTSYQSRLNITDLTRKCQHLTAVGVGQVQFQSRSQPIIWCSQADYLRVNWSPLTVGQFCPVSITAPNVGVEATTIYDGAPLFGIAYARTPEVSYSAPFSVEHGVTRATGNQQYITSIAVQRGPDETAEYLHTATYGSDGLYYVEMMMPFTSSTPFKDEINPADQTVNFFGTCSQSFMLDAARTPAGCKIASNGLSATFYGLYMLQGQTVDFAIRGKYVGQVTIGSDGSVNVPFSTAFLITDVGQAMQYSINTNILPDVLQKFYLDVNGNTGVGNPGTNSVNFLGQFGYRFRRRGKMLRPQDGTQNGPAFSKLDRNARMGVYVQNAQEVSIGSVFGALRPLQLTKNPDQNADTTTLGPSDYTTGIFRDSVDSDFDFNSQLCWEQDNPVPGAILAVGGFNDPADV